MNQQETYIKIIDLLKLDEVYCENAGPQYKDAAYLYNKAIEIIKEKIV